MDLKVKSQDPRRELTWNGKSLRNCSHDELMDCVIYLARQIATAQRTIDQLKGVERGIKVHINPDGTATSEAVVRDTKTGETRSDPEAETQPTVIVRRGDNDSPAGRPEDSEAGSAGDVAVSPV